MAKRERKRAVADQPAQPAEAATVELLPHRGWLVLLLGAVSLVCPIVGPVAWTMGKADLEDMAAGERATGGRLLTRIGMIGGIIGTAVIFLVFLACFAVAMYWLFEGVEPASQERIDW